MKLLQKLFKPPRDPEEDHKRIRAIKVREDAERLADDIRMFRDLGQLNGLRRRK